MNCEFFWHDGEVYCHPAGDISVFAKARTSEEAVGQLALKLGWVRAVETLHKETYQVREKYVRSLGPDKKNQRVAA